MSTDINPRGESLVEYPVRLKLDILNTHNEIIFMINNRKEVTDFALGTNHIGNLAYI